MGLFRKKPDPLARRAQSLNRRIAELEAEISKLNHTLTPEPNAPAASATNASKPSAVRPQPPSAASSEPVFEKMPPRPNDPSRVGPQGQEAVHLGLRRPLWSLWWRRMKRQFVDPPPTNEKLVSYLAAGGIQGLRPLRYERRVARNRMIFIFVVVGLLLWGLLVVFWHTR
ncbi:MAG: hypothetical protein JNK85_10940 [Verrucomicrobiales bacterium]|nr:hypothetical protein [Verrucomicrobiales bacterium]